MTQVNTIKKLSICLTAIALMLMLLPGLALAEQADISNHWARDQIKDWLDKGIIKGYPDGTFRPEKSITRAEFMVLINGSFNFQEKSACNYNDVPAGSWYEDAVAKAQAAGYISGYADGSIRPDNPISRQEAAIIIMKIKKIESNPAAGDKFKDASGILNWSKGAIGAVAAANIMGGYPDGTFRADEPIKRAEAVTALNTALNTMIKTPVTASASAAPVAPVTPAASANDSKVYDKAGTYGPESSSETVKGNVTIKAGDITLQNTVIEGDLTIAKEVGDGNATLKKVVVKGTTYIYGGGDNSIRFIDTKTSLTYVMKDSGAIKIRMSGTTEISKLTVQSSINIFSNDLYGKGVVSLIADKKVNGKMEIGMQGIKVESLEVQSEDVTINTNNFTRIVSLIANAKAVVKGEGIIESATINVSGVSFETKPQSQVIAFGASAPIINPIGWGTENRLVGVSSASQLEAAMSDISIRFITLTANITASPTITRPITMRFGTYTLTGDLTFNYGLEGLSVLEGNPGTRINGSLTVNTPNANFCNRIKISGPVNMQNVMSRISLEAADGNMLIITDPDGADIDVTGKPESITVNQPAGKNLTIALRSGASVNQITANAKSSIEVAAGAMVNDITAATGADGTTITNNGSIGTVRANAPINMVANVAPAHTITGAAGSVNVSGSSAASVVVNGQSTPLEISSASAGDITGTTATLNFTANKAGTYYYLVYAAADEAPDAAAIAAQGAAIAKGTAATPADAKAVNITGLTASTAYKAYLILKDAAGNVSAVAVIPITTQQK